MTEMNDAGVLTAADTIRFERVFAAPIERVWAFLTESDKRGQWLAAGPMDLRIGGTFELVFNNNKLTGHNDAPPPKYTEHGKESRMPARITALDEPHLLAYTWGDGGSEVRFELEPEGAKTRLVLTHARLSTEGGMRLSVSGGWHAHLGVLADRLAGTPPESFWLTHTRLEAMYAARYAAASVPTGDASPA